MINKRIELILSKNGYINEIERYEIQSYIEKLEQTLNEAKEDIFFCINDMKCEYACADRRTNRELHTMTGILEESIEKIDEVLGDSDE